MFGRVAHLNGCIYHFTWPSTIRLIEGNGFQWDVLGQTMSLKQKSLFKCSTEAMTIAWQTLWLAVESMEHSWKLSTHAVHLVNQISMQLATQKWSIHLNYMYVDKYDSTYTYYGLYATAFTAALANQVGCNSQQKHHLHWIDTQYLAPFQSHEKEGPEQWSYSHSMQYSVAIARKTWVYYNLGVVFFFVNSFANI